MEGRGGKNTRAAGWGVWVQNSILQAGHGHDNHKLEAAVHAGAEPQESDPSNSQHRGERDSWGPTTY